MASGRLRRPRTESSGELHPPPPFSHTLVTARGPHLSSLHPASQACRPLQPGFLRPRSISSICSATCSLRIREKERDTK
uniref:Uncharacterized protein n=1 Tax=Arundo donax TaxID=35708 RepID=A0A0A9BJ75_ARUDO